MKKSLFIAIATTICVQSPALAASSGKGQGDECPKVAKPATPPKGPQRDVNLQRANVMQMAVKLQQYLNANAKSAAIVSRAGSDLSQEKFHNPRQQKYTHAGFAVKLPDGQWRFIHLLNTCGGPSSDIYQQGLANFFADGPHFYDFVVGLPSEDVQDKIQELLVQQKKGKLFHHPKYSNISNPFDQSGKYQNSNQWLLTVLAAAQTGCADRLRCQSAFRDNRFAPSQVEIGGGRAFLKMLDDALGLGRAPNAHLDDHSGREKASGRYNFVSAASIYDYLRRSTGMIKYDEICHDAGCNVSADSMELKN